MLRLFRRRRATGRELLVEIIAAQARRRSATTPSRRAHPALLRPRHQARLVEARAAGQPTPPGQRHRRGRSRATIRYCRGVVLLGLEAPSDELAAQLRRRRRAATWSRASPSAAPSSPTPPRLARRRDHRRRGRRRHGRALRARSCRRLGRGRARSARREPPHEDRPPDHGAGAGRATCAAADANRRSGVPFFGGVWAIFGHGNVAGLGEALYAGARRAADLPRPQRAGHGACRHRLRQGELAAAA